MNPTTTAAAEAYAIATKARKVAEDAYVAAHLALQSAIAAEALALVNLKKEAEK